MLLNDCINFRLIERYEHGRVYLNQCLGKYVMHGTYFSCLEQFLSVFKFQCVLDGWYYDTVVELASPKPFSMIKVFKINRTILY